MDDYASRMAENMQKYIKRRVEANKRGECIPIIGMIGALMLAKDNPEHLKIVLEGINALLENKKDQ